MGGFPWFVWLAIALGVAAIVACVRILPIGEPPSSSHSGELRAAIVDQLYGLQPNEVFISQTTQELEACGFAVDLYQGDDVTVDFYRQLPSYGYRLIIFRTHSGLLLGREGELVERTCLFTNEPYSETKHIPEQLAGDLAIARVAQGYPFMFAIGPEFITHCMKARFDSTVIVVAGCSCIYIDDLAQAFIEQGASAYLAWDATVELDYVDEAALYLVGQLCMDKVTVGEAVASTMNVAGPDPDHGAVLQYFPSGSGDKTLKELVQ
jgi:hypothetical protein